MFFLPIFALVLPVVLAAPTPTPMIFARDCAAFPGVKDINNSKLPDPFTFINGQKVTTKADMACRRQELYELFQRTENGVKPETATTTASFSGNSLSITVSDQGKSISFSVSISKPSGTGPFPAIIAFGGASIPIPAGVATINFNNNDIGAQQDTSSRGKGKFFTLYGSGHSASAMTAWAWGVSRIIDAIEKTPATNINPKKIGVTGCSRNGKGAYFAGAFDERVALTLPQESGSGGSACWRLSDYQQSQGTKVQTASQIITENVWFSKDFEKYVNRVPTLPVDHHELAALVAPRGLYVIENTSMVWLGALSTYGCQVVGHTVYEALGVPDNMGYSQVGGHEHCQFPSSQNSELTAFIQKFLLDNTSTNTKVVRTDGNMNSFNRANWQDWTVPTLT